MKHEPIPFGSIRKIDYQHGFVDLHLDTGVARVQGINEHVIRLRVTPYKQLQPDHSYVVLPDIPPYKFQTHETAESVEIRTETMLLRLDREVFHASLKNPNGQMLSEGTPLQILGRSIIDKRIPRDSEDYFGLGERMTPLGRRGYKIDCWTYDPPGHHNESFEKMYSAFPFFIGMDNDSEWTWGYFLDSSYRSLFDMGASKWNEVTIRLHRGELNVYFIAGKSVQEVLQAYMKLTGTHAMPPIWALGYHQCRWSYMSTQEAREIGDTLRQKEIPCDAIWYDIHYMDHYRVFTFDPDRFREVKKHFEYMKKRGFKKVVIVDPGVKVDEPGVYNVHDEGSDNGFFVKRMDGTDYVGPVWPGGTKFPDFSNPEASQWWGQLHQRYYELGVDGFWNDMNEPVVFDKEWDGTIPEEVRMLDEGRWSTMDKMHNLYALLEAKSTVQGMLQLMPNTRPFLLTRSAFCGMQRYAAKWGGDNYSTWQHLRDSIQQTINMGLSGLGFFGADVGGFARNCSPELLARWTQCGAFYPFFRNHTCDNTIYQEPWRFGEEIEAICRDAINLRYRLLPYFYQLFYEMHKYGNPILRPLFWHYQDDPVTHSLADQFLVGNYLLVAPVVERGATTRKVYLPEGNWFDYSTGEAYSGKQWYVVHAPLNTIPIFVKAGSILPVMPVVPSTDQIDPTQAYFQLIPGHQRISEYWYEDDLRTLAYQKGDVCMHKVTMEPHQLNLEMDPNSALKQIHLRLYRPALERIPSGFEGEGLWARKTIECQPQIIVSFQD